MMWSAWRWVTKIAARGPLRTEDGVGGEPGPPQLAVHAFTAVDEVHHIVDDDGVGVPAPTGLRVGATAGPEQHQACCGVGTSRGAGLSGRRHVVDLANASGRPTCRNAELGVFSGASDEAPAEKRTARPAAQERIERIGNVCAQGTPVRGERSGSRHRHRTGGSK